MVARNLASARSNADVVRRFFMALKRRDLEAMLACYGADVDFTNDALFHAPAAHAAAFWQIYCASDHVLATELTDVCAADERAVARWSVWYSRGRQVLRHRMCATFRFYEGKIVSHHDRRVGSMGDPRTVGPGWLARRERDQLAPQVQALVAHAIERVLAEQVIRGRRSARRRVVRLDRAAIVAVRARLEAADVAVSAG